MINSQTKGKKKLLKSCIDAQLRAVKMGFCDGEDWLEKMSKRYYQELCPRCNKWHIWKKKGTL